MLFASEAGISLDLVTVSLEKGEQMSPEFVAINPAHAVPVLDHDGFILTESSTILKYLAGLIDSPAYPKELKARTRINEAMDWFITGFNESFGHNFVYPHVIEYYHWPTEEQQQTAIAKARERGEDKLAQLELRLGKAGPFICGAEITLADYLGACLVSLGDLIGYSLAPWPHVEAWMQRMKALPSWGPVNQAYDAWVAAATGK